MSSVRAAVVDVNSATLCEIAYRAGTWNGLSPLAASLQARREAGAPAQDATLVALPDEVGMTLARPAMRLTHRYGGTAAAAGTMTVCARRDGALVALLPEGRDTWILRVFETPHTFLEWWTGNFSNSAAQPARDAFPSALKLPVLLHALNALDCDQRARRMGRAFLLSDYTTSLQRTVTGDGPHDPRSLLASFLLLTPGIGPLIPELNGEQFGSLMASGLIVQDRDRSANGQTPASTLLRLASAAQSISDDFAAGPALSSGVQISTATSEGADVMFRCYLGPTERTNHLMQVCEQDEHGDTLVRHQATTRFGVAMALLPWIQLACHLGTSDPDTPKPAPVSPASSAASPSAAQVEPRPQNCATCRAPLPAAAKFCAACGTPKEVAQIPAVPCRTCGKPLRAGAWFCAACGTGVMASGARPQACAACGAALRAEAKFCNACGEPVRPAGLH
jgi:hypothetical protein